MDSIPGDLNLVDDIAKEPYQAMFCRCIDACTNGEYNSTCELKPKSKCYRKLELIDGAEIETAGCLSSLELHIDQCNQAAKPDFVQPTDFQCCWDSDYCNDHLNMKLPTHNTEGPDSTSDPNVTVIMIVSVLLAFAVGVFIITVCCIRFKQREKKLKREIDAESDKYGMNTKNLKDLVEEYSTPCSSGSGIPLLVQRTIARQIEILRELGRGRYGTVMLGKWRDEYVAVKSFNSTEEKSWARETEIYQTVLLRHENVLCFVASDINGNGAWTELYIITDYHANGSLYDYLQGRSLSLQSALQLAHTAASGLTHLHTEVIGTVTQGNSENQCKPGIAHRDIKSRNILVKNSGDCCIADMGFAVIYSSSKEDGNGKLDKGHYKKSRKQGTKRYMSPEVLSSMINEDSFDAFKASDVYSFALVLWEILNCTTVEGLMGEYRLPYYDDVGNDPDFEEMRKVVDVDNIRPEISSVYMEHPVLSRFAEVVSESWVKRPDSRLTMLRIRKTLSILRHGPLEDNPPIITDYHPTNGFTYISDRSNSSGFPTQSNDFYPLKLQPKDRGTPPGEYEQRVGGYSYDPQLHNGSHRLVSNGYSDSFGSV
ncbi:bone morphogenetic protein receptor type-1B-like [Styela clava]|uniref:bone morphogenetic protein receptor type-1B-like n=1 Tax=Styela clava TaxID=7725 RepID=UPI00193A81AA|nr:bone morphogenetic protein receptor type-1B-like [Styela clava]